MADLFASLTVRAAGLTVATFLLSVPTAATAGRPPAAPVSAAAKSRVVLATEGCQRGVRRPASIVFTCATGDLRAYGLRWSRWGGRVAVGRGTLRCDPACGGRAPEARPVTMRLYRRRHCPDRKHLYYRSATFVFDDGSRFKASVPCPY